MLRHRIAMTVCGLVLAASSLCGCGIYRGSHSYTQYPISHPIWGRPDYAERDLLPGLCQEDHGLHDHVSGWAPPPGYTDCQRVCD